jgi:hypothetical protein
MPDALWIMKNAPSDMTTSLQASAIDVAALAQSESM